jgi:hypothetical protein
MNTSNLKNYTFEKGKPIKIMIPETEIYGNFEYKMIKVPLFIFQEHIDEILDTIKAENFGSINSENNYLTISSRDFVNKN